jgi:hypothetical protein
MILSQEFDIIEHTSNRGPQMRRKLNRQTNLQMRPFIIVIKDSIPVFAFVKPHLGDLFRYKSHHENHHGHGDEHG